MTSSRETKRLGRGLSALIPGATERDTSDRLQTIAITAIAPNPNQPRRRFDEASLEGLMASIRTNGIVQPLIVTEVRPDRYELIAGERRYRAARALGLEAVPAIVRTIDERERTKQALIENVVREELNPIDEAAAISALIDEHGMRQEDVADVLGRSRSAVTNTLRLLQLDDELKTLVASGALSAGHARALLAIDDVLARRAAAHHVVARDLSVRQTEALAKTYQAPAHPRSPKPTRASSPAIRALETELRRRFGTKVRVHDQKGQGQVIVSYASLDELDRLLALWGLSEPR